MDMKLRSAERNEAEICYQYIKDARALRIFQQSTSN